MSIQLCELILERLELFLKLFSIIHELLPQISVLLKLLQVLGFWGKIGFGCLKEFMQTLELIDASLLEIGHEHVLPQNDNF
jgi:hypothetical protein